ncbi:MAG: hypothetical protein JSR87_04920 [Proteobacteria bacterium]|nr:hypothetical protein [Pseudomonadota bacterium]MBS0572594.1 hypothetical protein [Pseudomonadota bacterium]
MRAARQAGAGLALGGLMGGLMACSPAAPGKDAPPVAKPEYLPGDVVLMGGDLVQARVAMKGARGPEDVQDYARCWVAGYALQHGAGFVRQVRTIRDKEGGVWRADAVYSVTSALPAGQQTIDADVTVQDCRDRGIPTGQ